MVDNTHNSELIRAETLSSRNGCDFWLGDQVYFRRGELDHEHAGRVVGRTLGKKPVIYDIEDERGERHNGITIVRLDEAAAHADRVAEGVA